MDPMALVQTVLVPLLTAAVTWGALRQQVRGQGVTLRQLQAEVRGVTSSVHGLPDQVEQRMREAINRVDSKASTAHRRIDDIERGALASLTDRLTRLEERAVAHETANSKALEALTKALADQAQTIKEIRGELSGAIDSIEKKLDSLDSLLRPVRVPGKKA